MTTVARQPYPDGATPLFSSSGNVANSPAVATLTPLAGQTAYITGLDINSSGATGPLITNPTVTGLLGGTWTTCWSFVTGVSSMQAQAPGQWKFDPPLIASAVNQALVATLPAGGAGNVHATINAYGFSL